MSRPLVAALVKLLEGQGPAQIQICRASAFTAAQRLALEDLGRRTGALKVRLEGRGSFQRVVSIDILRTEALWKLGLAEYDEFEGTAWRWQSIDGAMMKAPMALQSVGPNPTDRWKKMGASAICWWTGVASRCRSS